MVGCFEIVAGIVAFSRWRRLSAVAGLLISLIGLLWVLFVDYPCSCLGRVYQLSKWEHLILVGSVGSLSAMLLSTSDVRQLHRRGGVVGGDDPVQPD